MIILDIILFLAFIVFILWEDQMKIYKEGWQVISGENVYVQNLPTGLYEHKEWHCWSRETGWHKLPHLANAAEINLSTLKRWKPTYFPVGPRNKAAQEED